MIESVAVHTSKDSHRFLLASRLSPRICFLYANRHFEIFLFFFFLLFFGFELFVGPGRGSRSMNSGKARENKSIPGTPDFEVQELYTGFILLDPGDGSGRKSRILLLNAQ